MKYSNGRLDGMKDSLDSEAIRRAVLTNGGDIRRTARELGMSHPNVIHHVRKANAARPLTYGRETGADQAAIQALLRITLERAGIIVP